MENTLKDAPSTTAFERFKDLTRRLIAVPKEELDAKVAEEKRLRNATSKVSDPKGV